MAQVPHPPFFFRIYSHDGQGIVYRADRNNRDSYMCTGSRQIGTSGSAKIWEVGGYADAMPADSMYSIMGMPRPMTSAQTNTFVDQNGLPARYKAMTLYTDGLGYWFAEKSRSSSPNSPKGSRGSKKPKSPKGSKTSKKKGGCKGGTKKINS